MKKSVILRTKNGEQPVIPPYADANAGSGTGEYTDWLVSNRRTQNLKNKEPEIPPYPLKERRENVRRLYIGGTARKDIAKQLQTSEDVIKKDLEWLRKRNLLLPIAKI